MKRLALILFASLMLSGCLATVSTVGMSLAGAALAGCDTARSQPGANMAAVNKACGSVFGR